MHARGHVDLVLIYELAVLVFFRTDSLKLFNLLDPNISPFLFKIPDKRSLQTKVFHLLSTHRALDDLNDWVIELEAKRKMFLREVPRDFDANTLFKFLNEGFLLKLDVGKDDPNVLRPLQQPQLYYDVESAQQLQVLDLLILVLEILGLNPLYLVEALDSTPLLVNQILLENIDCLVFVQDLPDESQEEILLLA